MQKIVLTGVLFSMILFSGGCFGQSKQPELASLCSLQQKITEGGHKAVQVSGIYGPGLDRTVLADAKCPKESTWVELDLQSDQNKDKLRKMLERSRRAYVVVEGEFYGPPVPDHNLPEALRKSYHPGWGHLSAFRTKLVVHAIREVKAVPTDHAKAEDTDAIDPGLPETTGRELPPVSHADVPLYPRMARIAGIEGTVQVEVTVKDGTIANTELKSPALPILVNATLENLKTWKFASDTNGTFRVTYIYEVEKEATASPGNPRIEMQLPNLIKITAKPPKLMFNYQTVGSAKTVESPQ